MTGSRFSALLLLLLLLAVPPAAGQTATANDEPRLLFVVAGTAVDFNGSAPGDVAYYEWNFSRWDLSRNQTRNVTHVLWAAGAYNATFRAHYANGTVLEHRLYVIVTYEEPADELPFERRLFLAIASIELVTSAVLLVLTSRLRRQRAYL